MKKRKTKEPEYLKNVLCLLPNSSREDAEKYMKELDMRAEKAYRAWIVFVTKQPFEQAFKEE